MKREQKTAAELEQMIREFKPDLKDVQFKVHNDSNAHGWIVTANLDPSSVFLLQPQLEEAWLHFLGLYELNG